MNVRTFISTALTLFALIIVCLSGCERVNQVVQPDAVTTPTETTLKIGVIQPANTFTTFSQGAETARAQINSKGGVLGMQVVFISRNNQPVASEPPTPEASISAAQELIDIENVFALLGPIYSTNAVEVGPIAQQAQRLMLPGSSGSNVPETGDHIFLITVPNPFQGKVMASFAMNPDELGAKTAATIIEEGDVYTTDLVEAFEAAFQADGGEIVHSGAYTVGDTTFTTLLTAIHEVQPDVIFCPGFQPEVPSLINAARQMVSQEHSSVGVHGTIGNAS